MSREATRQKIRDIVDSELGAARRRRELQRQRRRDRDERDIIAILKLAGPQIFGQSNRSVQ